MNEEKGKGRALASLLAARMRTDGVSVSSLASTLGISQGYLSQLLNGSKSIAEANEAFLRKSAEYLRLPAVTCLLMAGKLLADDFFDSPAEFPQRLAVALRVVAESKYARDVAVSLEQLNELPVSVQLLLVLQFEASTGVELIPGRASREAIKMAGRQHVPFEVRVSRSD